MIRRLVGSAALVAILSLGCTTEPCACSEPGARLVLYGVTTSSATGAPVTGAQVAATISDPAFEGDACSYPAEPSVDTPPPVVSDAAGRYRLEILTVARYRRCIVLDAKWGDPGARLALTAPELVVVFGTPSTTDSLRVDLALVRE